MMTFGLARRVFLVVLFATLVATPLQVHGWGSLFDASTSDDKPVEEGSSVGSSSVQVPSGGLVSPEAVKVAPGAGNQAAMSPRQVGEALTKTPSSAANRWGRT